MNLLPKGTKIKLTEPMDEPLVDVPVDSTGIIVGTWDSPGGGSGYCVEWDKKEFGKHSFDSGSGHRMLLKINNGVDEDV